MSAYTPAELTFQVTQHKYRRDHRCCNATRENKMKFIPVTGFNRSVAITVAATQMRHRRLSAGSMFQSLSRDHRYCNLQHGVPTLAAVEVSIAQSRSPLLQPCT